jgi:hypothetical protein
MIRHFEAASSVSGLVSFLRAPYCAFPVTALSFALVAGLFAADSLAAPINYGDFPGNTVIYQMVREAPNSAGDAGALFGAPQVFADSLDFDPVGFGASTTGGGVDMTDGNLAFMVKAKPGNSINNIQIAEQGDTTLAGIGTDTTFSSVSMKGILNISEVDFVGINAISIPISITNFSPSGGSFGLGSDGGGGPHFVSNWNGSTLIDLTTANPVVAAALASQGVVPTLGVTKISVNFNNTLVAISQVGTSALIAKKDNGIIITTNIPEPTSCLLAALGLALCGFAARRSR